MRHGLGIIGLLALIAVAGVADLLASDLPLACQIDGQLYLFPSIRRPIELTGEDNQTLQSRAQVRGGWVVSPPVPYGPYQHHPGGQTLILAPPSRAHLLGTDDRGRDVAARVIHGCRVVVMVGPLAVLLVLLFGVALGMAAGLHRGADAVLSRVVEIGLNFPTLFLLLAIQGLTERTSLLEVAAVVALTQWPEVARLVRAETLRVHQAPHVEAARALGATSLRVAVHHVLPFAVAPALTWAAFGLGQTVLYESALTFLGFGVPPPAPSWGELLAEAQSSGFHVWLWAPATLAIAASVLSCQAVADGLRARWERVPEK